MKNPLSIQIVILFCSFLFIGCKKDFLNPKPSTSILQPITLDDFQGLLENTFILNTSSLPTLSADEYYFVSFPIFQSIRTSTEKNAYLWEKDLFQGEVDGGDWSIPFQSIFYANNVLAGLNKIKDVERDISRLNTLKGWALFNRAFANYDLVSNFSPAYDAITANSDLGIPLRLDPSVEIIKSRSTVQETYDHILSDLMEAIPLLDVNLPLQNRNRPSRIAAYALLSRIYLSMRKYAEAENAADNTLYLYKKLIDYNTVSTTSAEPFSPFNDELIYRKGNNSYTSINLSPANRYYSINPTILSSYHSNDLRLAVYFRKQTSGAITMKYMYNGLTTLYGFSGLATDEIYLIKAECSARRNDKNTSLLYLNDLLIKRYKTGTFSDVTSASAEEALSIILLERKKELIFRNLRWSDLKRLNKEGANITLVRELNNIIYTLPPNDPRYIFPIPDNEISLSKIKQNIR